MPEEQHNELLKAFFASFGWLKALGSGESCDPPFHKPFMINLPASEVWGRSCLGLDLSSRLDETWGKFESPYASDRVVLAIQFLGYGSRKRIKKAGENSRWHLSRPLHAGSIGILRSLLPTATVSILGFEGCSSRSSASGAFESLFDAYLANPDHNEIKTETLHQVQSLVMRGKVSRGKGIKNSLLADTYSSIQMKADPGDKNSSDSELDQLLDCLNDEKLNFRRAIILSLMLLWRLFSLSGKPGFSKQAVGSDVYAHKEVSKLQRGISTQWAEDPDVKRSAGAQFPILRILKALPLFAINLRRGKIVIPEILQTWITKNFSFIFVSPLYYLQPKSLKGHLPYQLFPEADDAWRQYSGLFSCEPTEAGVAMDCQPLLVMAARCLDCGNKAQSRGWLTNRISETNEMTTYFTMQTGRVPDFPLTDLPHQVRAASGVQDILSQVLTRTDARLIVRCVFETENGQSMVDEWIGALDQRLRELLSVGGNFSGYGESIENLLGILRDRTGILVAAFEALQARQKPLGDKWIVYFHAHKLRDLFRTARRVSSKVHQPIMDKDAITDCHDPFRTLSSKILIGKIDAKRIADQLVEWEEKEGKARGETALGLLSDFIIDLKRIGGFGADEQDNVARIRKQLDR